MPVDDRLEAIRTLVLSIDGEHSGLSLTPYEREVLESRLAGPQPDRSSLKTLEEIVARIRAPK
jgi:putative addiction module component (TIGR02574 family)